MKVWEIVYYILITGLIINILLFHSLSLIKADYVTVLLLVILLVIPLIGKVSKIYFKDFGLEIFNEEEIQDIKNSAEKIIPEKEFKKIKENGTELEEIIEELVDMGHYDFYLGMVTIRLRLEQLVRDIFTLDVPKKEQSYRRGINWSLRQMSKKLLDKGIINKDTYILLKEVIIACNKAVHGFKINEENGEILYEAGLKLVAYFYTLREGVLKKS